MEKKNRHFNRTPFLALSFFLSAVQDECIPQAILGMDVICQAKSGMGKTAVFVIATLQQLEPVDGQVSVLIMCHARYVSLVSLLPRSLIFLPIFHSGSWHFRFTRSTSDSASTLTMSKSQSFLVEFLSRRTRRH